MTKEDCEVAVSTVVGRLPINDSILEGLWLDRPTGCFFDGALTYYNANPYGVNNQQRWHSVCHKIEVRCDRNIIQWIDKYDHVNFSRLIVSITKIFFSYLST